MAKSGLEKRDAPASRAAGGRPSHPAIYDEIRQRICLLTYPPGMLLKETELALEFGVSRTPIRDVLHRLMFEGLVETRNGVGTFVTGVDFKSFTDAYDLRVELAEMIGRLSPRPCEARHVAAVEDLLRRVEGLQGRHEQEAFWQINHDLHDLLTSFIGNRELAQLHELYYYKVSRFWYQLAGDNWEREVEMLQSELTEILRALRAGDMQAVAHVRRNHISFVKVRIGEFIATGRA